MLLDKKLTISHVQHSNGHQKTERKEDDSRMPGVKQKNVCWLAA